MSGPFDEDGNYVPHEPRLRDYLYGLLIWRVVRPLKRRLGGKA